jgi:hypothetical protein
MNKRTVIFPVGSLTRYTLAQAALALGITGEQLCTLLETHQLFAGWQGRSAFITDAELQRYQRSKRRRTRES